MEVLKMKVAQLCPTVWDPMDYRVHGILLARALECIAFPFSRGSSWPRSLNPGRPGIEPRSPTFQADSLPAKPPGKPKNTGVGSLSLLQWIFMTQGWNPDLPPCRHWWHDFCTDPVTCWCWRVSHPWATPAANPSCLGTHAAHTGDTTWVPDYGGKEKLYYCVLWVGNIWRGSW